MKNEYFASRIRNALVLDAIISGAGTVEEIEDDINNAQVLLVVSREQGPCSTITIGRDKDIYARRIYAALSSLLESGDIVRETDAGPYRTRPKFIYRVKE